MQIDESLLNKLERLSALKIPDNERQNCMQALSEVLEFANVLNELDTSKVKPHSSEFTPLREDEICSCEISQNVLKNAPARDEDYFSVPKIIE